MEDDEDSSLDAIMVDIKYQVPNGSACKNIVLTDKTPFGEFIVQVAQGMGTKASLLV